MRRQAGTVAMLLMLAAVPARAEDSDFLGIWADRGADASGVSRIVVTPQNGDRLAIHLFGKCQPTECDWGTVPARLYADGPDSKEVSSIAADFDTGASHLRLTLHPAVGHGLRIDVQADFADGSRRSNFATSIAAAYAGDWSEAPRLAASPPPAA
ncbi:MAG TPA: hypothetical protein VGB91_09535, partial [Rhizomicrobium sp.]